MSIMKVESTMIVTHNGTTSKAYLLANTAIERKCISYEPIESWNGAHRTLNLKSADVVFDTTAEAPILSGALIATEQLGLYNTSFYKFSNGFICKVDTYGNNIDFTFIDPLSEFNPDDYKICKK